MDPLEQIVQSQGHEDKKDLGDELARDTEAKEPLGGRDAGWPSPLRFRPRSGLLGTSLGT